MDGDYFNDTLRREGFRPIGVLDHRLSLQVWWHAERMVELTVMPLSAHALVKGSKTYYLKSISEEGETWARDIGPLHDYLENHFAEVHLSFSFFRDVSPTLAGVQVRRKLATGNPTVQAPTVEQLAQLQRRVERQRRDFQSADAVLGVDSGDSPLLRSYLRDQSKHHRRDLEQSEEELQRQKERLEGLQGLQREYLHKGSAARLLFTINSNAHVIASPSEFHAAVRSVLKELGDTHRYQVSQKLGGRLGILAEQADDPAMVWIEQWLGGGLAPRQLDQLGQPVEALRQASEPLTMVTPDQDIAVQGSVKDSQKLVAARVVSSLLSRLDRPDPPGLEAQAMTKDSMPATIGLLMRGDRLTEKQAVVPLGAIHNAYISGSTGTGKSFLQRVLVEEAAEHNDLCILILDPRNQSIGLLVAEDRPAVLSMYPRFGMQPRAARGFDFKYYAPGMSFGEKLPANLSCLATGRSIVSFKGLQDQDACTLFAEVLDAVFEAHAVAESAKVRLLILVEEAQRFTKKRVAEIARAAGERAERALDRTAREGRKYGQCVIIVSQTIKDFAYESASIRQNTNTKIFLRNSDREVDYASSFINEGRDIVGLPTGTAIVHNATWGTMKVRVRPPFSKVWEFSPEETRALLIKDVGEAGAVSELAMRLLEVARRHYAEAGEGMNLSAAARAAGFSSKRKVQDLVHELQRGGLVTTTKLRQRGQPRIILPVSSPSNGLAEVGEGDGSA